MIAANLSGAGPVLVIDTGYYRGLFAGAFLLKNYFINDINGMHIEENPITEQKNTYIIKNKTETLGYVTRVRNLVIISPIYKAVLMTLMNLELEGPAFTFPKSGDIAIYFQAERLLQDLMAVYPQAEFLKQIAAKNQYAITTIEITKENIQVQVNLKFKEPQTYDEKVIMKMLSMPKGNSIIKKHAPLRSSSMVSFSLDELINIYRYFVIFFKDDQEMLKKIKIGNEAIKYLTDQNIEDLLFSWMGKEMGTISLGTNTKPLFMIELRDENKFNEVFQALIVKNKDKALDYPVHQLELPGIFGFLQKVFVPYAPLTYYIIYQEKYLLFGNTPDDIKKFLQLANIKLFDDKDFTQIEKNLSHQGQLEFYFDLSYGHIPFVKLSDMLKKLLEKHYKMGGNINFKYPEIDVDLVISK
jgi:hypothetical protein